MKFKIDILKFILLLISLSTLIFIFAPIFLLIFKGIKDLKLILNDREVLFSIFLSFKTSILSTIFVIFLSFPTAYYIQNNIYLKKYLYPLIFLPLSLPHLVLGIALLLFFGKFGIGNFLAKNFNLDFIFTVKGIILAQTFVNLPFAIKFIFLAFNSINEKMIFTARNLGCNSFNIFFYIIFPILRKQIYSLILITWAKSLGEFGAVIMIAGATRMRTEILPTSIFLNISTGEFSKAISIATILIFLSGICFYIFEFLLKEKQNVNH